MEWDLIDACWRPTIFPPGRFIGWTTHCSGSLLADQTYSQYASCPQSYENPIVSDSAAPSGAIRWKSSSLISVSEEAQLILRVSVQSELVYHGSFCDRLFPLSENDTTRDAMARILAAFKNHVRVSHGGDVAGS